MHAKLVLCLWTVFVLNAAVSAQQEKLNRTQQIEFVKKVRQFFSFRLLSAKYSFSNGSNGIYTREKESPSDKVCSFFRDWQNFLFNEGSNVPTFQVHNRRAIMHKCTVVGRLIAQNWNPWKNRSFSSSPLQLTELKHGRFIHEIEEMKIAFMHFYFKRLLQLTNLSP